MKKVTRSSSFCQVRLPHGADFEDIQHISIKLKNKWIQGQAISNNCELKFKPSRKRGLKLETPGKIYYRVESQEKFKQHRAQQEKQERIDSKKSLVYKISEQHFNVKPIDAKITHSIKPLINIQDLPAKSEQKLTPSEKMQIPRKNILIDNLIKSSHWENKTPKNPVINLGYAPQNRHEVPNLSENDRKRSNFLMPNLQILTNVTKDLEMLTKKVQDIRQIVQLSGQIFHNVVGNVSKFNQTATSSRFETSIKPFEVRQQSFYKGVEGGLREGIFENAKYAQTIPVKTESKYETIWCERDGSVSKLINTRNTQSQYINISKRLDFDTFLPQENGLINPEMEIRGSNASKNASSKNASQNSDKINKRRSGCLSNTTNILKNEQYNR